MIQAQLSPVYLSSNSEQMKGGLEKPENQVTKTKEETVKAVNDTVSLSSTALKANNITPMAPKPADKGDRLYDDKGKKDSRPPRQEEKKSFSIRA